MPRRLVPQTDLTAGELSRKLAARFDSPVYRKGVACLENMLAFAQGGATLRPGTLYVEPAAGQMRIMRWVYARDEAYLLVFTNLALKIIRNGVSVATFTTPWTALRMSLIRAVQFEDRFVIVHPDSSPRMISRVSAGVFMDEGGAIPALPFNGPGLKFGQSVGSRANSTAYAEGAIMRHLDRYWYATVPGTSASSAPADGSWVTTATEDSPVVDGEVRWRWLQHVPFAAAGQYPSSVGFYQGRLWFALGGKLWASQPFDYGNFFCFEVVAFKNQQVKDPMVWYGKVNAASGSTLTPAVSPSAKLKAGETFYARRSGGSTVYQVSSWDGTNIALVSALEPADAVANKMWTFTRWSNPDQSEYEEVTIRRDVVGSGSAIEMELASDGCDNIVGLVSSRTLVVSTNSSEWVIPPDVTALTPQAIQMSRFGGSSAVPPTLATDAMIFFDAAGTKLREYQFSNDSGAYSSPDLTFLSDHILGQGATDMAVAMSPSPTIYVVRADGVLAALLYDKSAGTMAWSRYVLPAGGQVVSIAVIPSASGQYDEVYLGILRAGVYSIEKLAQPFSGYHLDAGFQVPSAGVTIAGCSHLGATTTLYDVTSNVIHTGVAVTAGAVQVPLAARGHAVQVGFAYEGVLKTMPIAAAPEAHGQLARAVGAVVRVIDSFDFSAGPQGVEPVACPGPTPYTGDVNVVVPTGWSSQATIELRASVRPFTAIGIMAEVDSL